MWLETALKVLSDYKIACLLFGAVFLGIGLVGGGITFKEIRVPSVSGVYRAMAIIVGAILIFTGVASPIVTALQQKNEGTRLEYEQVEYDTGIKYYRVCYVEADDPDGGLVVRNSPGVLGQNGQEHLRSGRIPPDGRHVEFLGLRSLVNQRDWYEIRYSSPTSWTAGWVNSRYLCPDAGECDCRL